MYSRETTMQQYVIFNDLHLYSPYELPFDPYPDYELKHDIILLGDIIDLYNCKYSDLAEAQGVKKSLEFQFGDRYISGNHELTFSNTLHVEKVGDHNVLFIHGDSLYWDDERYRKFRSSKPGASAIKRLGSKIWNKLRHLKSEKIANIVFDRASQLAEDWECHLIITGHQHPLHTLIRTHNEIMILCLPQGRHCVNIDDTGIQVDCLGPDLVLWPEVMATKNSRMLFIEDIFGKE